MMMFSENKQIPVQLFDNYIQLFFQSRFLGKLTLVCKNWQAVVNRDLLWETRLKCLISDENQRELLKTKYPGKSPKKLYIDLARSEEGLLIKEAYRPKEGWNLFSADLGFLANIHPVVIDPNLERRTYEFTHFIRRTNFAFFNTNIDYVDSVISSDNNNQARKFPEDMTALDTKKIEEFCKGLCSDNALYSSLEHINKAEFELSLRVSIFLISSLNYGNAPCSDDDLVCVLIKSKKSLILIIEIIKRIVDTFDMDYEELEKEKSSNIKEKLVIEITENQWKMLGYYLMFAKELTPVIDDAFSNVIQKMQANHQFRLFKNQATLSTFQEGLDNDILNEAPRVVAKIEMIIANSKRSVEDLEYAMHWLKRLARLRYEGVDSYKDKLANKLREELTEEKIRHRLKLKDIDEAFNSISSFSP